MEFQKFHISVKGLIKCNGKFLLLQEQDGLWEAPGGRVDEGEILKESLVRELSEELGLKLSHEDIGVLIGIDQRYDYKVGDGWGLITLFYEINLRNDFEVNLSDEHISYVWVDNETDLNKFNFKNSNQKNIFEGFKNNLL